MNRNIFSYLFFSILLLYSFSVKLSAQENISDLKDKIAKSEAEGNKLELANNCNKLAKIYWDQSKLDDAIVYFEKSVKINTELGNVNAKRIINGYLGLICLEKEDYNKAIGYFKISMELNKKAGKTQEYLSDL